VLQAKNITLYLFTPSEISATLLQLSHAPATLFRTRGENLQANSYSPSPTLIESFSLGEYGVTLESAMYFVVVSYSRTVPLSSRAGTRTTTCYNTCTGRPSLVVVILSPRRSAACVMLHSVRVSCCRCRLTADETMSECKVPRHHQRTVMHTKVARMTQ
jgi:hypothetical protein